MALGRRMGTQVELLVGEAPDLPRSPGYVFYTKLNELLEE